MTPSGDLERAIRRRLRLLRLVQAYVPASLSGRLLKPAVARTRLPAGVVRQAVSADGVACEWLIPQGSPTNQALLYLHGGGFVYGLTPQHLAMVAYLAERMTLRVLLVDYRLAPSHPFPAALDDCVTAYRWLVKHGVSEDNMVLAGDSAGGNLTITTLMRMRDAGEPLPAAAACLSPVACLSAGRGQVREGEDPLLHPRAMKMFDRSYVGGNNACDPLISPVFGDWRGLPPLLVHVGEDEILREDALRIERLARTAGVEVRLETYPRMWHVWQINLDLPQATESLDDIAEFLRSHLNRGG
jgi:monoterpene epsilon-lactone hydrolase